MSNHSILAVGRIFSVWRRRGAGALPRWVLGGTLAFGFALSAEAQVAASLDEALLANICRNDPAIGPNLAAQCAVFDIDAPTRTSAANGNNLGISGTQGRSSGDVRRRLDELREDTEGDGLAADWAIGKLGIFVTGDAAFIDRETTSNEIGGDTVNMGATVGADWRFSDALIAGLALTYGTADTDFSAGAGDLDIDSYGATLYASFAPNELVYVDAYFGYGVQDYDGRRNVAFVAAGVPVAASATSNTDGEEWVAGASAALDFAFCAWTIGPHAQLDYSSRDIDDYSENGGAGFALTFGDQSVESLQSVFGGHASHALSTDWGVLVPSAKIEWVHECKDDSRQIPASFVQSPANPFVVVTDEADRDFVRLGLGVSAVLPDGWVAFADYETQFAHVFIDRHAIVVGLRKEF